jgi:GAF domain-containing protein
VGADTALTQLLACVMEVAEAHGAALTCVDPDDRAAILIPRACGGLAAWAGARARLEGSITAAALEVGQAFYIDDATADPRTTGAVERAPEIRAVLAVPLTTMEKGMHESRSVLVVTRDQRAPVFGELELEMVGAFAAHAASALAQQQSREDREALRRLQDREQLAHELNDQLMQRLTRVGFALSGVASHAGPDVQRRLLAQVDELDAVVRTVRDTVLRPPPET